MDIREVVKKAREVSDLPGVVVPRSVAVKNFGRRVDIPSERVLENVRGFDLRLCAVSPIKKAVEDKTGMKIQIIDIDVGMSVPVYGYVECHERKAVVKIRAGLNLCWTRFTVVKELMHIYSNTFMDSASKQTTLLLKDAQDSRRVFVRSDNAELDEETSAFYMALEVLIPWKLRRQLYGLRDQAATAHGSRGARGDGRGRRPGGGGACGVRRVDDLGSVRRFWFSHPYRPPGCRTCGFERFPNRSISI